VLSWNRIDDTLAAIASSIEQQGVNLRVLVVDQSSDEQCLARLREFVRPYGNVRLQALGWNAGVAGGRNRATALGEAPIVVALDSDAVFARPDVLAKIVSHFDQDEGLGALAFRITNYFTRKNDATSWDYSSLATPDTVFQCSRFIGAGHAIRRCAFEKVGGYDEGLFFCGEELDLSYRLMNCGYRIEYRPDAEILHKVSPDHRVYWGRGRYYYTVRNNLYSAYKFGIPLTRLLLAAAAFAAKGLSNGIVIDTLRALAGAIDMSRRFDRNAPANASYRLSAETWQRIRSLEPWRGESAMDKVRRQFRRLPHQK
jgi:GT2 family glycosyltransferase